jgi:hypothetical protein
MPTNFYGKSNRVTINLTITTNTQNYNIYANRGGTYVAGSSDVRLTINSGVIVGSASTSTFALDTGTGWATGDTVAIVNNGFIAGCSGAGGIGGGNAPGVIPSNDGRPGNTGGVSLVLQVNTTITNGSGFIYSGGGGGGGSSDGPDPERQPPRPGYPGGNGAGFATLAGATTTAGGPAFLIPLRPGGEGGTGLGVAGNPGGVAPGGTGGGGGGGGAAGGFGVTRSIGLGGAAGAAGTAITRNGFTLTWVSGSGNVFGAQI